MPGGRAGVDYYFLQDDGGMFKATVPYEPYFCIACKVGGSTYGVHHYPQVLFQSGTENIVEEWLLKRYEGVVHRILREKKEDLKLVNICSLVWHA